MRSRTRFISILALSLASYALCAADQTLVSLSTYPSTTVADGHSAVTVTALVRDTSGKNVPDGTRVTFETTLGSFRNNVATTAGGVVHVTLVAGNVPGIANITVSAQGASPSTMEFEFVGSRAQLSSAQEYIEVVAPGFMQYAADSRVLAASGPGGGVSLRYRDISITADDIQLDIPNYVLRARKAKLRIGKFSKDFDSLYMKLNERKGLGTTTFVALKVDAIAPSAHGLSLLEVNPDGKYEPSAEHERYGVVEVIGGSIRPNSEPVSADKFEFIDLSDSISSVAAKKAVVFPRKEIQFQRAEVYVAGTKVMKLPLFEVNLANGPHQLVTDQILNVNDNQLQLNYPYYLSLQPGQSSLLRLQTGDLSGRGYGSDHGVFLNYELAWNRGDDFDGGLTFGGIARDDWSLGLRQYLRVDDKSSAFAQVTTPQGRGLLGSTGYNRQIGSYSLGMSGNMTRVFSGLSYTAQDYALDLQRDPVRLGHLPLRWTYGLTATENSNDLISTREAGVGLATTLNTTSIPVDRLTSLLGYVTVKKLAGQVGDGGLSVLGNLNLHTQFSRQLSTSILYDYTKDGFNDQVIGNHHFGMNLNFENPRTSLSIMGGKSLGVDRSNLYADLGFRVSPLWRLTYRYTWDRFFGDTFFDYGIGFGYRIGGASSMAKEVGLVWSQATQRIGFQLVAAP